MSDPVTLHSLLGNHPSTKALKSGQISSALVTFDYFEVNVANTQFKAMVRDLKYDFGELAIDKGELVVPARIERRKLIDAVEDVAHKLFQEHARRHANFAAEIAGDCLSAIGCECNVEDLSLFPAFDFLLRLQVPIHKGIEATGQGPFAVGSDRQRGIPCV